MSEIRLCTQAELEAMCIPPRKQFATVLESGDKEAAKQKYGELEDAFFGLHIMYQNWVAFLQEFIYSNYGHEGLAGSAPIAEVIMQAIKFGMTIEEADKCSRSAKEEMSVLIDAGKIKEAKDLFKFLEKGWRDYHDLYNSWTTLLLSRIYRDLGGLEALEKAHRYAGGSHWMPWMEQDIQCDPKFRIQYWSMLMHGNLCEFTIEEDDEKFIMKLHVCGSCGRQIIDGYYKEPINFAMVKEKGPETWYRDDCTVYQTHLTIIHAMMSIEKIGAPWPVITCNNGKGPEPCQIILYKNPKTAAAEYYEMVGKQKPKA